MSPDAGSRKGALDGSEYSSCRQHAASPFQPGAAACTPPPCSPRAKECKLGWKGEGRPGWS